MSASNAFDPRERDWTRFIAVSFQWFSFGLPISRRPQKSPKDNPYKRVVYAPSRPLSTALLGPE
jgi:hypothetical protein